MECRLISLNDSPELHRMTLGEREFVFTGCDRAKGRFIMTALRAARRKVKVVLAAHPNLGPLVQAMRVVAPRLKSIVCTHGVEVWEPLSALRRRALRHASVVLAPSRDTADHVASEQQVARERIRVLHWGLDPQFEALLAPGSQAFPPGDFPAGRVILTVGRWLATERYKGMDTLITALPRLLTRWPELQLALAGEGDDRAWLEDLSEQNGVNRHVHFLSGLSSAELAGCYGACEMFALPSRGEGFGLVYLEAMALGKVTLGCRGQGPSDFIQDGLTGYLVEPRSLGSLVQTLSVVLANWRAAEKLARTAREDVWCHFTWCHNAEEMVKLYGQLVSGKVDD